MITLRDLEQYRQLVQEMHELTEKLNRVRTVSDTVKGSSRQKPYHEQTITITGISEKHEQLHNILENRIKESTESVANIERFITEIQDPALRRIIDYRYVQGLSWADTSKRVYNNAHKDTARKVVERFFAKS